ncbi:MAG: Xaa-Pro aminopeptidase [Flammeovirgaceae bacterium]|jgi:Xaa-Pro aminopeptidase|nr:Xaa-Pro aminopeptidase [Flammeovirgaceae bacterium]
MFTFRLFEKSIYAERRNRLKQLVGNGLIVLPGNDDVGMNYRDNTYPFRQDSTFLYYFGLNTTGLCGVIDIDSGNEYIFGDDVTVEDIVWTGPLPTVHEMANAVGVHQTFLAQAVADFLQQAQNQNRAIHYLPPYRGGQVLKLCTYLNQSVKEIEAGASLPLIKAIVSQRQYKEDIELQEMDHATRVSVDMHLAAMKFARPGMKEYEVIAKLREVAQANNCGLSFNPIVTVRGETLHNLYSGNTLTEGQLLLVDSGANNDMLYAGDLTTTYPVGKKFTAQQREVYETVLKSYKSSVALLKPRVLFKDVYVNACLEIVEGMKAIGLMKGNAHDAVQAGAHALFFQCGLGHMIGLDVHDMENLGEQYVGYTDEIKKSTQFGMKSLRLGKALEAGFTFTVEPGVYFIPQLMDQWKAEGKFLEFINYSALHAYRNFGGIRVEECYSITQHGARLLGKKLPLELTEVEDLRGAVG